MPEDWSRARRTFAVLFAVSFFLPLAQCPHVKRTAVRPLIETSTVTSSASDRADDGFTTTTTTTATALADDGAAPAAGDCCDITAANAYSSLSAGQFVYIALFFWPLGAELGRLFRARRSRIALALALVLCGASASGVLWIVWWGRTIRFGAFVAFGAILGYAVSLVAANRTRPPSGRAGDG